MTNETYDVIVIGDGSTSENMAQPTAKPGLSTVVEKELVGGECSYWACMPSKACCDQSTMNFSPTMPSWCVQAHVRPSRRLTG